MIPSQPWIIRPIVKLRRELAEKTQDMTKLIVAQHVSTVDAVKSWFLVKGKVVGQGTHKELLANNRVYQEIAYSPIV